MATTSAPEINMLDREFWKSRQHDAWTWARAHDPVYFDANSGIWAITKHADILYCERHDEIFSSEGAYRLNPSPGEANMIAADDPQHLKQRRLVNRGFTPSAVDKWNPHFDALLDEMIAAVAADKQCEVVGAFAGQLPARFTCALLGLPDEQWPTVKVWSEQLMRIDAMTMDNDAITGMMESNQAIYMTLAEKVPELQGCPVSDGLLSKWSHAQIDGRPMSMEQIHHETGLFVAGGAETTRTAIGHGLRIFCDHQDQWEALYANPQLLTTAVDEVIRYVTPLNNMFRRVTTDTEVHGKQLKAGDRIALVYPSGNRDEDVFDDPFRFDITRDPNPHVSFGYGTHFCIGRNFARRELETLFGKMNQAWTNLHVVDEIDVEPNIFAPAVRSFTMGFEAR
jgi:cytochrome P450 family 142 subfamily A polypeptide 1